MLVTETQEATYFKVYSRLQIHQQINTKTVTKQNRGIIYRHHDSVMAVIMTSGNLQLTQSMRESKVHKEL